MSNANDPRGVGSSGASAGAPFDAHSITRPDPVLMKYYLIGAACTLVGFPFVILPLYFRYHTLRYRFDDEGIAMSWGILWRHEIYLTYRRIQDIHVTRGLVQRWLGLATIAVQTASGSATPEMSIEGILQFEQLRDYLYQQMRGAKGLGAAKGGAAASAAVAHTAAPGASVPGDEALSLLRQIRDELATLRSRMEARGGSGQSGEGRR